MVSIETEARVARLLLALAEGERTVEISRQVLSDNYDFDAYQIFKTLDVEGKNRVDSINIVDFLRSKGVYSTEAEAQFVVLFYDQDADGALSYCEFLNLVQSEKSVKRTNAYSSSNKLSFNVEYSLGKVLEKEIGLVRNITSLLSDLKARYDFNVHEVYHLLKSWNSITAESLKCFLDKNSVSYLDSDVQAIIKRLDLNRDGRVDLCELHAFLGYPSCGRSCPCTYSCSCKCCSCCCSVPCCHLRHCSPRCRSISPLRRSCSPVREQKDKLGSTSFTNQVNSSTMYQTNTPERTENIIRTSQSPEIRKISPNLSLRLSPERRFSPRRTSPRNSPMRQSYTTSMNMNTIKVSNDDYEKNQFVDYLKMVMDAESKVERAKIDLALRADFNVEDAFRVFELDGRGFLTEEDLKYGLNVLEIYPTCSDVRLLMKRFDLQKEGVINYADFFDMVTPYEKDYRNMVENRPPNSCCACRCPDVFMITTRIYLKNLFNSLIDYENKFNMAKKGYATLRYKLRDVFKGLDRYGLGYFNEADLANYLKNNYSFTTPKDSDLLFIRLDRNRNGKVEYWEIEDELAPSY